MISPGCTCTCRQTGAQLWVVRSAAPNGRWHLVGKRTDTLGRKRFTSRVAGEGDLVEILAAKTYRVGDVVERHGMRHVVLADDGDDDRACRARGPRPAARWLHGPSGCGEFNPSVES